MALFARLFIIELAPGARPPPIDASIAACWSAFNPPPGRMQLWLPVDDAGGPLANGSPWPASPYRLFMKERAAAVVEEDVEVAVEVAAMGGPWPELEPPLPIEEGVRGGVYRSAAPA